MSKENLSVTGQDIYIGIVFGGLCSLIFIIGFALGMPMDISNKLNASEFYLRGNTNKLNIIMNGETEAVDLDNLTVYYKLDEQDAEKDAIKYELMAGEKRYELSSIKDKIIDGKIISLDEFTDARRKELSDFIKNEFKSMYKYTFITWGLGAVVGAIINIILSLKDESKEESKNGSD